MREAAVVIRRDDRVLLCRRPDRGRWAGMWEFPHAELRDGESLEVGTKRVVAELMGLKGILGAELLTIRHAVTRFRIELVCFAAKYKTGRFASSFYREGLWLTIRELANYPVSAPQRRLAQQQAPAR